ncbi:hypothetical protein EV714DRAFT_238122 [Schizophyllum commune]
MPPVSLHVVDNKGSADLRFFVLFVMRALQRPSRWRAATSAFRKISSSSSPTPFGAAFDTVRGHASELSVRDPVVVTHRERPGPLIPTPICALSIAAQAQSARDPRHQDINDAATTTRPAHTKHLRMQYDDGMRSNPADLRDTQTAGGLRVDSKTAGGLRAVPRVNYAEIQPLNASERTWRFQGLQATLRDSPTAGGMRGGPGTRMRGPKASTTAASGVPHRAEYAPPTASTHRPRCTPSRPSKLAKSSALNQFQCRGQEAEVSPKGLDPRLVLSWLAQPSIVRKVRIASLAQAPKDEQKAPEPDDAIHRASKAIPRMQRTKGEIPSLELVSERFDERLNGLIKNALEKGRRGRGASPFVLLD